MFHLLQISYRQFANKLWNAVRFALNHFQPDTGYTYTPLLDGYDQLATSKQLAPRDRWILSRLSAMLKTVDTAMTTYAFSDATTAVYNFWLYEFCDYYLELVKPLLNPGGAATAEAGEAGARAAAASAGGDVATAAALARLVLYTCLDAGLRALHPMMPFVTEELWQRLPGRGQPWRADGSIRDPPSIMVAPYPRVAAPSAASAVSSSSVLVGPALVAAAAMPDFSDARHEAHFDAFKAVVRAGRHLRSNADIVPSREAEFVITARTIDAREPLQAHSRDLITLLRASSLCITDATPSEDTLAGFSAAVISDAVCIFLEVSFLFSNSRIQPVPFVINGSCAAAWSHRRAKGAGQANCTRGHRQPGAGGAGSATGIGRLRGQGGPRGAGAARLAARVSQHAARGAANPATQVPSVDGSGRQGRTVLCWCRCC